MSKPVGAAGRPGWSVRAEVLLSRFQRPGIRVRDIFGLYLVVVLAVIVAVALFFIPLMWIFS